MKGLAGIAVFAVAVALVPAFVTSGYTLNAIIMTLYAALLAQAWNILGGFGGQFSFGNCAFLMIETVRRTFRESISSVLLRFDTKIGSRVI